MQARKGDDTKILYNTIAIECPSHVEGGDGGCQRSSRG